MTDLNQLSDYAVEQRASDIHLAAGMPPVIRVDGEMRMVRVDALTGEEVLKLLNSIMNKLEQERYQKELELDFAIELTSKVRYRVNAFYTISGPAAALRLIPTQIKTLKDLTIISTLESFTLLPKGLVLVTGPTGSGKSTTLAGMIEHINTNSQKHIITIEDPIEFIYKSKKCLINQRGIGGHTHSFTNALRSALREDPDVILVGEIRDLETMQLALTAAETGHLVLGTLHTNSAAQTINRIIDIFPGGMQPMIRSILASSLEGIVSQRLLKRANGVGRVAAFEVMVATNAIRNMIREDKIPQIASIIQLGVKDGMIIMSDYIDSLIKQGMVNKEDVGEYIKSSEEIIKDNVTQQIKTNTSSDINKLVDDEF
jgi:twitching motility protein PilT